MAGKWIAAVGALVGAGVLTGCCLFSGNPTVTIMGPTTATVGVPVTFTATATGGGGTYTYQWSFGASGPTATYTFTAAGTQTIGVTVTDNCGKQATTMHTATVSEGTGGGGNLTGLWTGTLYDQGIPWDFRLQLNHSGTSVTGLASIGGATSPGTGSYVNGQFTFQFQAPGSAVFIVLVGSYNPYANELSGEWTVGGINFGSWRVRRY
ncbi:MAG: PKD domain-containing protein [Candidatus Bipolaricaulota bacterium]|nr:PKD domain-containing protein [Candidatus Bipolaricaulota bacterium]